MKVDISLSDMKRIIKSSKKFVSDSKYIDNGNIKMHLVFIEVRGQELTATALDGHKIVREHVEVAKSDGDFSCYIKPELPKGMDFICTIESNGEYSTVSIGDYTIRCKQPVGVYYEVDKVMKPNEFTEHYIGFNTKLLRDAINAISTDKIVIYYKDPKAGFYIKNVGKTLETEQLILPINIGPEI